MQKEIFNGKVIKLVTEEGEVNGQKIDFEKVYLKGSVHVFVVTNEGKIRLVKEERWDHDKEVREKVPAGIIEDSEAPLETAKRELKEELGLEAKDWEEFLVSEQKGTINDIRYYFLARNITQGDSSQEPGELIVGHEDRTIDELFNMVIDGYFGTSPTPVAITRLYAKVKSGEIKL